jgi:hypothetical protein
LARATRVAAVVRDPKLFPSRSIPERHAYADVTARGWNRLLLGLFTYLGGPARLDDVVTVAGVLLHLPGAASVPTGAAVPLPEPSGEHVRYEEMDALVENTADAALQSRIAAHGEGCAFCARQVAAYQAAAEQVSAQLQKPVAS